MFSVKSQEVHGDSRTTLACDMMAFTDWQMVFTRLQDETFIDLKIGGSLEILEQVLPHESTGEDGDDACAHLDDSPSISATLHLARFSPEKRCADRIDGVCPHIRPDLSGDDIMDACRPNVS